MTLAVTHDVSAAVAALLVVPTAGLVFAVNLARSIATTRLRECGLSDSSDDCLRDLISIRHLAFDADAATSRTHLRVRAIYPSTGVSASDVLRAAASAEADQSDRIGEAIRQFASQSRIEPGRPTESCHHAGTGVRAILNGEEILVGDAQFVTDGRLPNYPSDDSSFAVFVMRGGQFLGSIALAEVARPDAARAITRLRELGVRPCVVGTFNTRSEAIAQDLRVEHRLLPAAPMAAVVAVADNGLTLAVCGRRFVVSDWTELADMIGIVRRAHRIVRQTTVAMAVIGVAGIAVAAAGKVGPIVAAAIHATSSLGAVAQVARLSSRTGSTGT